MRAVQCSKRPKYKHRSLLDTVASMLNLFRVHGRLHRVRAMPSGLEP
jgi:hypothetical protein